MTDTINSSGLKDGIRTDIVLVAHELFVKRSYSSYPSASAQPSIAAKMRIESGSRWCPISRSGRLPAIAPQITTTKANAKAGNNNSPLSL